MQMKSLIKEAQAELNRLSTQNASLEKVWQVI